MAVLRVSATTSSRSYAALVGGQRVGTQTEKDGFWVWILGRYLGVNFSSNMLGLRVDGGRSREQAHMLILSHDMTSLLSLKSLPGQSLWQMELWDICNASLLHCAVTFESISSYQWHLQSPNRSFCEFTRDKLMEMSDPRQPQERRGRRIFQILCTT